MLNGLSKETIININHFLPYVGYRDGELFFLEGKLRDVILSVGTPSIVYCPDRARDQDEPAGYPRVPTAGCCVPRSAYRPAGRSPGSAPEGIRC